MRIFRRPLRGIGAMLGVTMLLTTAMIIVTPANPASAAKAKKSPIKIGTTIWNLPSITLNDRYPGIQAAVAQINKAGGVHGHKLIWEKCEAADANGLESCARKFISEGVVATVSDAALIDEQGYGQILKQAGIPQVDPFITSLWARQDPNDYLLSAGANLQYAAIPMYMKIEKLKTVHLLYGISSSANDNISVIRQAEKKTGIKEKGAPTGVPLTAADYLPYAADASSANAQVNIAIFAPFQTTSFLQAAAQLGKKLRIGYTAAGIHAVDAKKYPVLDGSLLTDSVPPLSATKQYPAIKTFLKGIKPLCKRGEQNACAKQVSTHSLESWLDVKIVAEVAKGLKNVTAKTVKHALDTTKKINTFGLTPRWTPSKKGPAGYNRVSNGWTYLITVKHGKSVLYQKKPINVLTIYKK